MTMTYALIEVIVHWRKGVEVLAYSKMEILVAFHNDAARLLSWTRTLRNPPEEALFSFCCKYTRLLSTYVLLVSQMLSSNINASPIHLI